MPTSTRTIRYGWFKKRSYTLFVPSSYKRGNSYPLVISLHGFSGNSDIQQEQTHMNVEAEEMGYIVAYPDGLGRSWNAGPYCCGYANSSNSDDVGFMSDIIDDVSKDFSVNKKKVYVCGMSNGGMMSYYTAISMPEKIAAIGVVSGSCLVIPDKGLGSKVPVIHFHGDADPTVPMEGGAGPNSDTYYNSMEDALVYFGNNNGVDFGSPSVEEGPSYFRVTFNSSDNKPVVGVVLKDGGHEWPGGVRQLPRWISGNIIEDVNATKIMLEFFANHSRD